jgi:hypothetical protein
VNSSPWLTPYLVELATNTYLITSFRRPGQACGPPSNLSALRYNTTFTLSSDTSSRRCCRYYLICLPTTTSHSTPTTPIAFDSSSVLLVAQSLSEAPTGRTLLLPYPVGLACEALHRLSLVAGSYRNPHATTEISLIGCLDSESRKIGSVSMWTGIYPSSIHILGLA